MRSSAHEFGILDQEGSLFVGVVGLHRIDWSRRSAGLGYWTRRSAWDQGLATEGAAIVLEHGFRTLGLNRIEAHVALENRRSQRVLEKLSFLQEGVARALELLEGRYVDHIQYSLLREDFLGPEGSS
jgi:ribosomal-protein-serine acetyltransferase